MKSLNPFRKSYLVFSTAILLLFTSCNQYGVIEERELKNINFDFKKLKNDIAYISDNVKSDKIHNFNNFEKIFKNFNKNISFTENDYMQAKKLLIQSGWNEGEAINPTSIVEFIANQLNQNLLIGKATQNFIIQNFTEEIISNPYQFNLNVQLYLNSNNLTGFEKQFLNNINLELLKTDGCDVFGSVLGFGMGLLIGASGWGAPVAGIAGGFVSLAAADVCRGIAEY